MGLSLYYEETRDTKQHALGEDPEENKATHTTQHWLLCASLSSYDLMSKKSHPSSHLQPSAHVFKLSLSLT